MLNSRECKIDLENHKFNCRICLTEFTWHNEAIRINSETKKRFLKIFQLELTSSPQLSEQVCSTCDGKLKEVSNFVESVNILQKKLLDFVKKESAGLESVEVFVKCEPEETTEILQSNLVFQESLLKHEEVLEVNFDDWTGDFEDTDTNFSSVDEEIPLKEIRIEVKKIEIPDDFDEEHFAQLCTLGDHKKPKSKYKNVQRCAECGKWFISEKSLHSHIENVHNVIKKHLCDLCPYRARNKYLMVSHMKNHVDKAIRLHRCNLCDYTAYARSSIYNHNKAKHGIAKFSYSCSFCDKKFTNKVVLRKHIQRIHEKIRKYGCNQCDKKYFSGAELKKHKINHHSKHALKKLKEFKEPKPRTRMCVECGKIVSCTVALRIHIASVHNKVKNYECDLCPFRATNKPLIYCHMRRHFSKEKRSYKCPHCDYTALARSSVYVHKKNKHSTVAKKSFDCHCGMTFTEKVSLRRHTQRIHENVRNKVCEECGESFFVNEELRKHLVLKHNVILEKIMCNQCDASFPTRAAYSYHKSIVHRERYKCTHEGCKKSYPSVHKLNEHKNSHLGKRPFSCHLCDKAYFTMNHLRLHLDVAHQRSTYYCEFCEYTNGRRDYLRDHMHTKHKIHKDDSLEIVRRARCVRREV